MKQKSRKQIEQEVFNKMDKLKIPRIRWAQMNDIIDSIIVENAKVMKKLLISDSGNWDPIGSTKNE